MTGNVLLAVEAMTLGVKRMADYAKTLGYQLELLADDPGMYMDRDDTPTTEFPTKDSQALEKYIQNRRSEIAGIFSSTDTWGLAAARLREKFDFPSRITSDKLSKMRDKAWVQKQITDNHDPATFPQIAKPRGGTGSMDIHILADPESRDQFLQKTDNPDSYLYQPFYHGPLYSAEIWCNGDQFIFFGVTNRIMSPPPLFLEQAKSFPHNPDTDWEQSVQIWVQKLVTTLNYDLGLAHIEFIETADGFQLVELNARMAGALITPAILDCTNYDPYALAIADALDIVPELPHKREIIGGYSHVSLYAHQTGRLDSVQGLDHLPAYPGKVGWMPSKDIGDHIAETSNYRARIGNVLAHGPSAIIAQDRALSAANSLQIIITSA